MGETDAFHCQAKLTLTRMSLFQREFTLLLFPLLARKLSRTVPSLISHPPILAHTIYQALAFDSAIREEGFELDGTSAAVSDNKAADGSTEGDGNWKGITEVILGKKEWFEAWMEGERKCKRADLMDVGSLTGPVSRDGPVLGNHQCARCLANR